MESNKKIYLATADGSKQKKLPVNDQKELPPDDTKALPPHKQSSLPLILIVLILLFFIGSFIVITGNFQRENNSPPNTSTFQIQDATF